MSRVSRRQFVVGAAAAVGVFAAGAVMLTGSGRLLRSGRHQAQPSVPRIGILYAGTDATTDSCMDS